MYLSHPARWVLRGLCALVLVVLYTPILYVARLSVNTAANYAWPPSGFTLEWWQQAFHEPGPREALLHSVQTGLWATAIALVARNPGGVRVVAASILRTQRHQPRHRPADRASRAS